MSKNYPTTPDGRYFVHKERLWRCTNPSLSESEKSRLVKKLMAARRAVKAAKASGDSQELRQARELVNDAKIALGERGPTWWGDEKDYNRTLIKNSPYATWWQTLENQ